MRPIPEKIRRKLEKDPFMKRCVACSAAPVEWHHPIIYAGKQTNFWYTIIPLCFYCHRGNGGDIQKKAKVISEIMAIKRGMSEIYRDMPKIDWYRRKRALEDKLARL